MRPRRVILVPAAVVCVGLLWLAREKHRVRTDAETRLTQARQRETALRAELEIARKTVVPEPASPVATPPIPAAEAPKPPAAPARKAVPGLIDLARDNPDLWNQFVANSRAQLQQRYGMLFQNLNLTLEQREKFKVIHAAGVARSADIAAAGDTQQLGFDDPALKKLRDDAQKQTEAELMALLGEAGFRAYKDFDRGTQVRGFVDGFAVQMATSDPLTPGQAEQLSRALTAASPSFQQGAAADPKTLDWAAVDRAAEQFLSAAQYSTWKLGTAHNRYGGSRADLEFEQFLRAARAKAANGK